jgi:hypothetical protein
MKSLKTFLCFAALSAIAAFNSGCATASKPTAMIPPIAAGTLHASAASVAVTVTGGQATSAAGMSQISNEDFATAVRAAIEQSKVFAQVSDAASDYQLDAYLARLQQPMFGFSMTVTLEVDWKLTRKSDHAVVWQRAIESKFTAGAGESVVGATRLRKANEGAARENISQALGLIAGLDLP